MVPLADYFMTLLISSILGKSKISPNERIMSFLHWVIKRRLKVFALLRGQPTYADPEGVFRWQADNGPTLNAGLVAL